MTKTQKILVVAPSLTVGGGADRAAAVIGSELNKLSEYDVTFLTFSRSKNEYEFEGNRICINIDQDTGSSMQAGWILVKRAYKIARICRRKNIDTILSYVETANFAIILSGFFGCWEKKIVTVQNNPDLHSQKKAEILSKLLYPFADKVVAVSRGVDNILEANYGLSNTTTIYNSVDLDNARKQAKESLPQKHKKLFTDSPVFVNIGRFVEQKGQWHLIRAFSKVIEENPDAKLVILGDGELRPKLEKLVDDCGISKNVFLLGNVENVFTYLRSASRFVFSSLHEGLGNVVIESLSVGTPVISADCVAGPREILAPNLSVGGDVKYPHDTEYGTLTQPLEKDYIFTPPAEQKLTTAESMLKEAMLESIDKKKRFDPENRMKQFTTEKILNNWLNLIS